MTAGGKSETEGLLPCVWCGGKAKCNELRRGNYRREGDNYQVVCNKCRARGPLIQNERREAITAWNRRAPQPVGEGVWLPIETAPKDGTAFLGCWAFPDRLPLFGVISWGQAPDDDTWAGSEEGWLEGETCVAAVTHWMPLPSAPRQAENSPQTTLGRYEASEGREGWARGRR